MENAVLVYQAGIANVFEVETFNLAPGGTRKRLLQSDFRTCENFARGLATAGVKVGSVHCNRAGDIANAKWSDDLDGAPFRAEMRPVFSGVVDRTGCACGYMLCRC